MRTAFSAVVTAITPQSLLDRVLSITISVVVLGLVVMIMVLGGWIPWAPEELSVRVSIASLFLGFLALVGVLLAMLAGGFDALFVNESRDSIHKFGLVAFGGAGAGDVYDLGGTTFNYPFQTAAAKLDVQSGDDKDSSLDGKGAHTVVIIGLDEKYEFQRDRVDLNGTETKTTQKSFLRVNRAFVTKAGAQGTNVGTITIAVTGGGDVLATIGTGNGQTLQCVYTVEARKVLLMREWSITVSDSVPVTATLRHREFKGAWRIQDRHLSSVAGPLAHNYPVDAPLLFNERSDIKVHVKVSATASVSAEFAGILSPSRGRTTESGWS